MILFLKHLIRKSIAGYDKFILFDNKLSKQNIHDMYMVKKNLDSLKA